MFVLRRETAGGSVRDRNLHSEIEEIAPESLRFAKCTTFARLDIEEFEEVLVIQRRWGGVKPVCLIMLLTQGSWAVPGFRSATTTGLA